MIKNIAFVGLVIVAHPVHSEPIPPELPFVPDKTLCTKKSVISLPFVSSMTVDVLDKQCLARQELVAGARWCKNHSDQCEVELIRLFGTAMIVDLPKADSYFYSATERSKDIFE